MIPVDGTMLINITYAIINILYVCRYTARNVSMSVHCSTVMRNRASTLRTRVYT